jgi:NAD-dependent SIR2 family protein deacetylase
MDNKLTEQLARKISSTQSAIFCGAGISANSGIPIVHKFLEYFFKKIELNRNDAKTVTDSNLPFEKIIELISNESTIDELLEMFSIGHPTMTHRFIAKLTRINLLNTICTTNFDTHIENALLAEGLGKGSDFDVYISNTDLDSIDWDSKKIKVIKIHGCVSQKDNMVVTLSQIASNNLSPTRKCVLKEIFCRRKFENVFVMGYSCSDLDLCPIMESLEENLPDIIFVEHHFE